MCCGEVGTSEGSVLRVELARAVDGARIVGLDGNRGELWGEVEPGVVGGNVGLTLLEARLAWVLLCNAGIILSPRDLLDHVWDYSGWDSPQLLYSCLGRVASKGREVGLSRWWDVKRGFGYWVDGLIVEGRGATSF